MAVLGQTKRECAMMRSRPPSYGAPPPPHPQQRGRHSGAVFVRCITNGGKATKAYKLLSSSHPATNKYSSVDIYLIITIYQS